MTTEQLKQAVHDYAIEGNIFVSNTPTTIYFEAAAHDPAPISAGFNHLPAGYFFLSLSLSLSLSLPLSVSLSLTISLSHSLSLSLSLSDKNTLDL